MTTTFAIMQSLRLDKRPGQQPRAVHPLTHRPRAGTGSPAPVPGRRPALAGP